MLLRHWIALTVAAVAASACDPNEDPPSLAEARPRPVAPRPQGTVEAIEEKLAELEQRIQETRAAVRSARETRDRVAVKIQEWEREGRALRRKLESARSSGAWKDVEKAIDRAMVEIETTLGASEQAKTEG